MIVCPKVDKLLYRNGQGFRVYLNALFNMKTPSSQAGAFLQDRYMATFLYNMPAWCTSSNESEHSQSDLIETMGSPVRLLNCLISFSPHRRPICPLSFDDAHYLACLLYHLYSSQDFIFFHFCRDESMLRRFPGSIREILLFESFIDKNELSHISFRCNKLGSVR